MSLKTRLAAAERALGLARQGILRVVITGDPERMGRDVASSGDHYFQREPDESVEQFRLRAAREAEMLGEHIIIFDEDEPKISAGEPVSFFERLERRKRFAEAHFGTTISVLDEIEP